MTREDIVAKAEAEFGSTDQLKYLRYGGIDFRAAWCMAFVSWVFGELNGSAIPYRRVNCTPTRQWFRDRGRYMNKGTYTPIPGDLIFYDWDNDDSYVEHVGIVRFTDDDYVYTVEGNVDSRNGVSRVGYKKRLKTYGPTNGYGHTVLDDIYDPTTPWDPEEPGSNPYNPPDEHDIWYQEKRFKWWLYPRKR